MNDPVCWNQLTDMAFWRASREANCRVAFKLSLFSNERHRRNTTGTVILEDKRPSEKSCTRGANEALIGRFLDQYFNCKTPNFLCHYCLNTVEQPCPVNVLLSHNVSMTSIQGLPQYCCNGSTVIFNHSTLHLLKDNRSREILKFFLIHLLCSSSANQ